MNRIKRAKTADRFMTIIFYCIAVFFFMLLAAFAGYVIIKGFAGADASMFKFSRRGSIGNQLFNTIYLVFLSLLITVPIGTFAGIYLAKYAKGGIITKFIRICIETLSSLPSIVVGLFGYLIFLVIMGMDKSLMAGALSVSILTLPLITTTTEETVVLLSHKKPDSVINVKVEFGEGEGKIPLDNIEKRAESYKPKERVTYKMIKEYIEAKHGFKVHTAYIAEVKRDLGLPMYDAPNAVEELKQPRKHPTPEKVEAIKDALKHFEVI